MTSKGGRNAVAGSALLLLVLIIIVALLKVEVPGDASAGILALVTIGAVAIERILETFWTIVGTTRLGNWWPLKPIGDRLNSFVDELNKPLNDFYEEARARVQGPTEAAPNLEPWLKNANDYLTELRQNAEQIQRLRPGDPRALDIAGRASRAIVGLQKHYPGLQSAANDANRVLAGVNKFVQTFEDNPARRLLSLFAGAVLGLLAAGLLGLDAIQAVFGGVPSDGIVGAVYGGLPGIGAAVTGLAMGLGATPAHELVKTLKEVKERNKARATQP